MDLTPVTPESGYKLGDKVTVTVAPSEGYVFGRLTANGAEYTSIEDNKITVILNAVNVEINVEFVVARVNAVLDFANEDKIDLAGAAVRLEKGGQSKNYTINENKKIILNNIEVGAYDVYTMIYGFDCKIATVTILDSATYKVSDIKSNSFSRANGLDVAPLSIATSSATKVKEVDCNLYMQRNGLSIGTDAWISADLNIKEEDYVRVMSQTIDEIGFGLRMFNKANILLTFVRGDVYGGEMQKAKFMKITSLMGNVSEEGAYAYALTHGKLSLLANFDANGTLTVYMGTDGENYKSLGQLGDSGEYKTNSSIFGIRFEQRKDKTAAGSYTATVSNANFNRSKSSFTILTGE